MPKDYQEEFWKMLADNAFVKSTNSVTDQVEEYPPAIVDMEATVAIHGEFDKEAIDAWLTTYGNARVEEIIKIAEGMKKDTKTWKKEGRGSTSPVNVHYNQALTDLIKAIKK